MNKEEYTEIDNYNLSEMLFNRDERLIEMIKGLREERDYIFNKLTCEKGYLQEILNKEEARINKAIEYIEENKNLSMFADLRKEGTHQYDLECDADDLLKIIRGEDNE